MHATSNTIRIEYEMFGDPSAPTILLIMGLGAQLTLWPMAFVEALVERGFHVIRFDNRDCGLSAHFDAAGRPNLPFLLMRRMLRLRTDAPYRLEDMANDAVGLLDALDIDSAHIVGASMGGMIAQHVAFSHPARVRSLTSIMSTTGNPALPNAHPAALRVLLRRPRGNDLEALVAHGVRASTVIGNPGYPADPMELEASVRANVERAYVPDGYARQIAAIITDGDRRERLLRVRAPTLVLHGIDDPLIPVEGGRDTARTVAGARLIEYPGMGHGLPLPLIPSMADAIAENAAR